MRRGSWLRSDREHCASRVAVEQEDEEDEEDEEEEEEKEDEEEATDIKSNNPHLAGGEETHVKKQLKKNGKTWKNGKNIGEKTEKRGNN